MRILIDIGHPAHVHLFKNFAWIMQDKGNQVLFTTREKEFEIDLLKKYQFDFVSFGEKYNSTLKKIIGLVEFDVKMLRVALKFKPDIFLSHGSMYAAQIAWLLRKPHISFEDTGNWEQIRLYKPFTKAILTSDVFPFFYGEKQIRYQGHHEIAYLRHPYYKPNPQIFDFLKITKNTKYAILRFVSWNATHDVGQKGLRFSDKLELIDLLEQNQIKIFISSENKLPPDLQKYQIKISPEQMHDALYHATLFVGEGATMAMESGVLGTPAIYINPLKRSYCEDLKNYGLVYNFQTFNGVDDKIKEIIFNNKPKEYYQELRKKLLSDKIDVTKFLIWFVLKYPESYQILKQNPEYQLRFR